MDAYKKEGDDLALESEVAAEFHNLNQDDVRAQLIEYFNTCSMCGSDLEFSHATNFMQLEVVEEAYCPSCNVRNKKEAHRLH